MLYLFWKVYLLQFNSNWDVKIFCVCVYLYFNLCVCATVCVYLCFKSAHKSSFFGNGTHTSCLLSLNSLQSMYSAHNLKLLCCEKMVYFWLHTNWYFFGQVFIEKVNGEFIDKEEFYWRFYNFHKMRVAFTGILIHLIDW